MGTFSIGHTTAIVDKRFVGTKISNDFWGAKPNYMTICPER